MAYGRLLAPQLYRLHLALATHLEQVHQSDLASVRALIAHHLETAASVRQGATEAAVVCKALTVVCDLIEQLAASTADKKAASSITDWLQRATELASYLAEGADDDGRASVLQRLETLQAKHRQ